MIRSFDGTKMTANQKAKELIIDKLCALTECFDEDLIDGATAKEKKDIIDAILKQEARVRKLLGYQPWGS